MSVTSSEATEFIRFLNSIPGSKRESSCRILALEHLCAGISSHLHDLKKKKKTAQPSQWCLVPSFEEAQSPPTPSLWVVCIQDPGG